MGGDLAVASAGLERPDADLAGPDPRPSVGARQLRRHRPRTAPRRRPRRGAPEQRTPRAAARRAHLGGGPSLRRSDRGAEVARAVASLVLARAPAGRAAA